MFHTFPVPRPHPRRRIPRRLARPGTVTASAAFPPAAAHFPTPLSAGPTAQGRPRDQSRPAVRPAWPRPRPPWRISRRPLRRTGGPEAARGGQRRPVVSASDRSPIPPRPGRIPPARLRRPAALPAIPPAVKPPCFPPPPRLPPARKNAARAPLALTSPKTVRHPCGSFPCFTLSQRRASARSGAFSYALRPPPPAPPG